MRLGLVLEGLDPRVTDDGRASRQIAAGLARRGHDVTLLAPSSAGVSKLEGLSIDAWRSGDKPRSTWALAGFARWADQRLEAGNFDASLSFTSLAPAMVVAPRTGILREQHARTAAGDPSAVHRTLKRLANRLSPGQRMMLRLERRTFGDRRVRRFAALSRHMAEQLRRQYGVAGERVALVRNGAETPPMDEAARAAARRRVRNGFSTPEEATAFLFAAHDTERQGFASMLAACAKLSAAGRPFVLLFSGPVRYAHQRLAERLGVREQMRFIGKTRRTADLYCAADVTVLPSVYDPTGVEIIESLRLGTPAITTRLNAACDFLLDADGEPAGGRVVPDARDVDALADAMAELLEPAKRQRCRTAITAIADELTMDRHVDELEALLTEAARSSH